MPDEIFEQDEEEAERGAAEKAEEGQTQPERRPEDAAGPGPGIPDATPELLSEATPEPPADPTSSEPLPGEPLPGEPLPAKPLPAESPEPEPDRRGWFRRHPVRTGFLAGVGLLLLVLAYEAITWPNVAALAEHKPETTAFIERYKARQRALGTSDGVRWRWVSYNRISPHLKRAVLVSEDINFFSHDGFDTAEMKKALEKAWEDKEVPRGASTLTQQLAKNLWLSPSKNPLRKVKETLLTRQLEARLSKRRILELYLNVVELGPGIYGAEAGAQHWFGTSAAGLGERQAAQLAASLPRPKTWNPGAGSRGYADRVESILRRMGKAAWLWKVI